MLVDIIEDDVKLALHLVDQIECITHEDFDAAETLFTTRGSVGQIYGSIARRFGSKAPDDAIQAAFVQQFRGAGPISTENQKEWWKNVVRRVFTETGMIANFDQFFEQVYD